MNRKDLIDRLQALYKDEDSRVTVNPHAGQKVAIVYPNTYFVGMSNLGLHIIYEEINLRNNSVCERIFLPEKKELEAYDKTKTPLMSVETQRPMHQFDVVAFDVTFEMDYFHIPLMLRHGRVPIMGKDRTEFDPIVIAGGPCATFNPEPFADFIDAFIIGEGEGIVSRVLDIDSRWHRMEGLDRHAILRQLAEYMLACMYHLCTCQFTATTERFKGYHIAEGAPKTITTPL